MSFQGRLLPRRQEQPAAAAATSSGFNFGSAVKPTEPISDSPFQFGKTEQQPALSTTNSPFQFGKTNNDTPKSESLFGAKPTTTTAAPTPFQFSTQKSGDMSMLTPEAGTSTVGEK